MDQKSKKQPSNSNLAEQITNLQKEMRKGFVEVNGLIKLTRHEMATKEELNKMKGKVDKIYTMLDGEAKFIRDMRLEFPLLVQRVGRLEK